MTVQPLSPTHAERGYPTPGALCALQRTISPCSKSHSFTNTHEVPWLRLSPLQGRRKELQRTQGNKPQPSASQAKDQTSSWKRRAPFALQSLMLLCIRKSQGICTAVWARAVFKPHEIKEPLLFLCNCFMSA